VGRVLLKVLPNAVLCAASATALVVGPAGPPAPRSEAALSPPPSPVEAVPSPEAPPVAAPLPASAESTQAAVWRAPAVGADVRASTLAAERALLDRARRDLLTGDPAAALDGVEKHATRFPRGVLREERDALRVEALVGAGRYDQARSAGERFAVAFPDSMLRPAVRDALRTIP
jgi:hypothetical protein